MCGSGSQYQMPYLSKVLAIAAPEFILIETGCKWCGQMFCFDSHGSMCAAVRYGSIPFNSNR